MKINSNEHVWIWRCEFTTYLEPLCTEKNLFRFIIWNSLAVRGFIACLQRCHKNIYFIVRKWNSDSLMNQARLGSLKT